MFRTDPRPIVFAALTLVASAKAQNLRHGVWAADRVVVARVTGVRPLGEHRMLHTLTVSRTLKGERDVATATIIEDTRVSDRPKPVLGPARLYCLRSVADADIPDRFGPVFRMTGFRGDHPAVSNDPKLPDWSIALVEALITSEQGASPRDASRELVRIALRGTGTARIEAVETLREREALRDRIHEIKRSELLARAVGESKDVPFKCALASLCAELRMTSVVDALCLSLEETPDDSFAETIGRLARYVHGESALDVLRPHITRARRADVRDRLLLALGATKTESALQALLRYRDVNGPGKAIDAALRQHGTKRAIEAIAKREKK